MSIYDTFLFNDELDMLECRLYELEGHEDLHHVLVEAPFTHQGTPKPLYFEENAARFEPWKDRITHVVADIPGPSDKLHPWNREYAMRETVREALDKAGCIDTDYVLLCDLDEIPSHRAVTYRPPLLAAGMCRLAMFAVDWVCDGETPIFIAGPWKDMQQAPLWMLRRNDVRSGMYQIPNAGWHFTWLGGPAAIRRKLTEFCHLELADIIRAGNDEGLWYQGGKTWHNTSHYPPSHNDLVQMQTAVVDETWPRYIRERRCPDIWFRGAVD